MQELRQHGVPQLRIKRHHLSARAVDWITEHVVGVTNGLPCLKDGRAFDVASVVWATGFRQVYDWVDLPLPIEDGWPVEYRGVVDTAPGLYFCGLAFQYCFASGEVNGVGRDAAYLAQADRGSKGGRCPRCRLTTGNPRRRIADEATLTT